MRCRFHRHGKSVPAGEGKGPFLTLAFKANLFKELNLSHDVKTSQSRIKCGKIKKPNLVVAPV